MSGGSQHNPNGRQSQLGPGWSPLQVANFLARAPQVHLPADRGVTWHTPTPPPHLYHVPAPSPPDPLQAMKSVGSNSVFRHSATPPELFRHTPTPPDKHLMRHTPSPGDVKGGAPLPQAELYPHLGPGRGTIDDYINNREKHVRPEELLAYARVGVDLSLSGRANGSPSSPALSVRDAPTINSLIARAARPPHARVDALLERLAPAPAPAATMSAHAPAPASPLSVIVHPRAAPTPSPPSSNEDSADSCGAPPGSKRKRKPERTIRVPSAPPLAPSLSPSPSPAVTPSPALSVTATPAPAHCPAPPETPEPAPTAPEPTRDPSPIPTTTPPSPKPIENGDTLHAKSNGPEKPQTPPPPPTRRKTRSGSAETIDDIAAMIASTDRADPPVPAPPQPAEPVTVDNLKSVLASPEPRAEERSEELPEPPVVETAAAAAPRRRSARTSNSETANVPIESPSEAKPAEPETSEPTTVEPTAASFVEVENQLEKMFAGIEEQEPSDETKPEQETAKAKKRRKSAPTKGDRKAARRASRASTADEGPRRKNPRKKETKAKKRDAPVKDAYDSGSNASSSRSRGPYIQIRGPRDSPLSVSVINAQTGEEEDPSTTRRKTGEEFRNGLRARGLHASTLGLRYDATTPDATWRCAFCDRGPHAQGLGDLFGPYTIDNDCEEYRSAEECLRREYRTAGASEVWFHEACGVWAPGVVAAGARLWGLGAGVWAARCHACMHCRRPPAPLACTARGCVARASLPCARQADWQLDDDTFQARCPVHKP
ncbi:hypothetical protein evm_009402 [Chilo suppressalis]|nr:hypothetical protein evm_009402 [Chilo suppressalis]